MATRLHPGNLQLLLQYLNRDVPCRSRQHSSCLTAGIEPVRRLCRSRKAESIRSKKLAASTKDALEGALLPAAALVTVSCRRDVRSFVLDRSARSKSHPLYAHARPLVVDDLKAKRHVSVNWIDSLRGISGSQILPRILSPILCNTGWACLVFFIHNFVLPQRYSTTGHSLLIGALGLLLVFRTNTAYSRFWEGRQIWQRILDIGRDVSRAAVLYRRQIGTDNAARICRLLQAFPFCMIEHLRGKKQKAMRMKLERLIGPWAKLANPKDCDSEYTLPLSSNRPLFIVNQLASAISSVPNEVGPRGMYTNRERTWLLQSVEKLSSTIGACERLVQTPVPLSYARHTSRFLSIYMLSLPWVLVESLGAYAIIFTCFASWALFGIFEIGIVIEDPFQGVLKVEVIANTLQTDIEETIRCLGADELLEAGALGIDVCEKEEKADGPSERSEMAEGRHRQSATPASPSISSSGSKLPDATQKDLQGSKDQKKFDESHVGVGQSGAFETNVLTNAFKAFKACDANADKTIDRAALTKLLLELSPLSQPTQIEAQVETVFSQADLDQDSLLTMQEWCNWIESAVNARALARAVLRMPSSPLLPTDSQDDEADEKAKEDDEDEDDEGGQLVKATAKETAKAEDGVGDDQGQPLEATGGNGSPVDLRETFGRCTDAWVKGPRVQTTRKENEAETRLLRKYLMTETRAMHRRMS
eukprot:TRINITY_DN24222_c0_g2_i1.p1 TRINITY_DN24222_c0_g2~~TRINITY_DN24222_c0_g2_i1.p1  ORF type:complete len:704 (-),score=92.97 TRINITY_DN24222_c0_g2_i1:71-2182(-)